MLEKGSPTRAAHESTLMTLNDRPVSCTLLPVICNANMVCIGDFNEEVVCSAEITLNPDCSHKADKKDETSVLNKPLQAHQAKTRSSQTQVGTGWKFSRRAQTWWHQR